MSELNATNLRKEHVNEGPDLVGLTELTSPYFMVPPSGATKERPQNPQPGTLRFNTDIGSLEFFRGDTIGWESIDRITPNLDGGARGVWMGGRTTGGGNVDVIEYCTISTLGNNIDFGNLSQTRRRSTCAASAIRQVLFGGQNPNGSAGYNIIDYITFSSTGNAVAFGDLTDARMNTAPLSNGHGGL